jgi:hypothetical protein
LVRRSSEACSTCGGITNCNSIAVEPFGNASTVVFDKGVYGIVLRTWGNLTEIKMRLLRRYPYRGRRHSFISAGCSASKGFLGAIFPLARTSFTFVGGKRLSTTLNRSCRVRG